MHECRHSRRTAWRRGRPTIAGSFKLGGNVRRAALWLDLRRGTNQDPQSADDAGAGFHRPMPTSPHVNRAGPRRCGRGRVRRRCWPALCDAWMSRQGAMLSIKDAATGRYACVNAAMATFLGRTAAQVRGHVDAELFDPALATAWRAAEQTALAQAQPLRSEHRFEWAGRAARLRGAAPGDCRRRRGPALAVQRLDRPGRRSARRTRNCAPRSSSSSNSSAPTSRCAANWPTRACATRATGLYTRPHFEDQLRREVDLSTREHREFALVLIEIDPLHRARGANSARRRRPASSRPWAGCCAATRVRWTPRAGSTSGASACCCRAWGWPPRTRAWKGCGASAPRRSSCSTARSWASACRWAWPAFRTPPGQQQELLTACEGALAEARRRGGNHLTLASIRFEAG